MKKKIIDALKNKYKNLGFGDAEFEAVASYLEPAIKEEKDIETAIGGVEPLLKGFQSANDKLRTEKAAAERKHAELEAKVKEIGGIPSKKEPEEKSKEMDEMPPWAKSMFEKMDNIGKQFDAMQGEKLLSSRRDKLNDVIKSLPDAMKKTYARIDIKNMTDDEFNSFLQEESGNVAEIAKSTPQQQKKVFSKPIGGGNVTKSNESEASKEEIEDVVSHLDI